jgi:DNA uptake protein ComE-like DNA-binding protein
MEATMKTKRIAITLAAVLFAATLFAATPRLPDSAPRPVVNVNTATIQQLQYLPGVGKVMAERIVAGRPYRVPGSLIYVKGIKEAKLHAMFSFVTVKGPTTATAKIHAGGGK